MTITSNFKNRDSFGILSSCSFYIWGWGFEFLQKIGSIVVPFFHSKLTFLTINSVMSAKGITKAGLKGPPDVFCKVSLGKDSHKTHTIKKTKGHQRKYSEHLSIRLVKLRCFCLWCNPSQCSITSLCGDGLDISQYLGSGIASGASGTNESA